MTSGILYHTGLLTNTDVSDEANDICGARVPLMRLADEIHAHLEVVAWDDPKADSFLSLMVERFDFVAAIGHSHGAWRADTSARKCAANSVDVVCLIDECPPFDPLAQVLDKLPAPLAACSGCAFWQRNSQPSGVAFIPRTTFDVHDVSGWVPKLGHIDYPGLGLKSIAGDSKVWQFIRERVINAFVRKNAT